MLPWNVEDLELDEDRFTGVIRLFPLPEFVMYPHVMQPLRIFERRYRAMLNEALDNDGLIATVVLAPDEGSDEEGRPKIESTACLGKIVAHHRLEDGCYNVMLLGARRVKIVEEIETGGPFRQAVAEIVHDEYPSAGDSGRAQLQARLSRLFRKSLPRELTPDEATYELLETDLPLGVLADLAAFASPLSLAMKIKLLGETDADVRARLLLRSLAASLSGGSIGLAEPMQFPSHFSSN